MIRPHCPLYIFALDFLSLLYFTTLISGCFTYGESYILCAFNLTRFAFNLAQTLELFVCRCQPFLISHADIGLFLLILYLLVIAEATQKEVNQRNAFLLLRTFSYNSIMLFQIYISFNSSKHSSDVGFIISILQVRKLRLIWFK